MKSAIFNERRNEKKGLMLLCQKANMVFTYGFTQQLRLSWLFWDRRYFAEFYSGL